MALACIHHIKTDKRLVFNDEDRVTRMGRAVHNHAPAKMSVGSSLPTPSGAPLWGTRRSRIGSSASHVKRLVLFQHRLLRRRLKIGADNARSPRRRVLVLAG